MKNILVTGGTGFIGSHTYVELINAGYKPVIIDNFSNSEKSVLRGLEKITNQKPIFYQHDYRDEKFLTKIFKKHRIEGIIHFAAYKAVGGSIHEPLKYYQNNVAGLLTLIEVMEKSGVSNLIFSSSAVVYGDPDKLPLTEDSPLKPSTSPYGASKQMDETIVRDCTYASKHLRSISLRYFNPIGAHPSSHIGELPRGVPANLVPFLTQAAAGVREELTVFGADYDTPDGTGVRDYIHVVDVAKAHVKALQYLHKQSAGFNDIFNIGTGKGNGVLELIKTFEEVTNQKVPYKIGPRRGGDVASVYAGVTKAQKTLGWKAEKSLADSLLDAWRWQQKISRA